MRTRFCKGAGDRPWLFFRTALCEEKRRLEARVSQLEEELEEEKTNSELMSERLRKATLQVKELCWRPCYCVTGVWLSRWRPLQVETLTVQLQGERTLVQKAEATRDHLDKQNKELKTRLTDLEGAVRGKHKLSVAALEAKIDSMEEQLEQERQ